MIAAAVATAIAEQVLIETYWNVNLEVLILMLSQNLVLIETYWNVNQR